MTRLLSQPARRLMTGVSLFTLCVAAVPAMAQQQQSSEGTDLQEVVVSGIREEMRSAQSIKQNAEQMVDSVTAVDIGALPDRSVTEVLQRVPGVTISRTSDPRDADRLSVQGGGVQIRGLSWVRGEFDGRDSFAATKGRPLNFADVPPELMAGVDVYKNPSADLIEGGLGGTVNLRTRMPFDAPGQQVAFSADYTYGDLYKQGRPQGSLLYSNRWNTPIGEMGLLIDLSEGNFVSRTDTISVDPYYARTDLQAGKTVSVPGGFGYRSLDFTRERQGADVAFQWRPSNELEFSARYLRSAARETSQENAIGIDPGNGDGPAAGTSFNYDGAGNFLSGTLADAAGGSTNNPDVIDNRWDLYRTVTNDSSIHAQYTPSDHWNFSADVQYVYASAKQLDFTVFEQLASPLPASTLAVNGSSVPSITMPNMAGYLSNPANYYLNAAMDYHNNNVAYEWAERMDGEYSFDEGGWLDSFRFGLRHTDKTSIDRETNYNWGGVVQTWGANGLQNLTQTTPGVSQTNMWNVSNFFRGGSGVATNFIVPSNKLAQDFYNGSATALHALSVADAYGNWTPFNGDYSSYNGGGAGVNMQTEQTNAGYGLLRFKHQVPWFDGDIPMDGNVGLRLVQTSATGTGSGNFVTLNSLTTTNSPDQQFANGARSTIEGGRNYVDALPSVNLRVKPTSDLQWRFAFAQSIVRPDFSQLQPSLNIGATVGTLNGAGTCVNTGASTGNCVYQYTGFAGNPNLRPMTSNQYDTSLEWYFAPTGSVSGALFTKDLYGFITTSPHLASFTNNGVTRQVLVTQPYNAGEGQVRGFELDYQQIYDFLPHPFDGLGLQANYTFVDSSGARNAAADPYDSTQISNANLVNVPMPLEGMSKNSFNIAGIYEKGPVSLRLAYNWRERYLLTTSAANINEPAWADDFGQLDGSIFYSINEHLKVGLEATNLTNSMYRVLVGYPGHLTYHNWVLTDRSYALSIRGNF